MITTKITHLKQVACDEFLGNNSVNVTADNVNEIFTGFNMQEVQLNAEYDQTLSEQGESLGVDNLIQITRTLPKELYITEILKLSSSDRSLGKC